MHKEWVSCLCSSEVNSLLTFFPLGQDRFDDLMPQFCRNAAVAVVMCDVTRPKTLQTTRIWKKRVDEIVLQPNGQSIPAVLLINKVHCTCIQ